jgi:hypothetical protein
MSITFQTNNPSALLAAFKKGIHDGHIVTWMHDKGTDMFTHTPPQWRGKAWLSPVIEVGQLRFKFFGAKGVTWEEYGVYHGRFIEAMIVHCRDLFVNGSATSKPSADDFIAAA